MVGAGAWVATHLPLTWEARRPRPATELPPRNCPPGTRPIDRDPRIGPGMHQPIKEGIGNGPRDWTGITPDGHIISTDHNGDPEDHGPYENFLP